MSDSEFYLYRAPKICRFCSGPVPYTPLAEMEELDVKVYFCSTCIAEYCYFWDDVHGSWQRNGQPSSVSLYTTINTKVYRWTISSTGDANLWYIKNPGIPGTRKNIDLECLKSFMTKDGSVPEITPQNINDKIRTWLVFL